MRVSKLLVFLAACAAPKPLAPPTCPPPVAPREPEIAADLDDAQVKAKSHAFLDGLDRASADEVQDMLAPSFVAYEEQSSRDRDAQLDAFRRRADRHAPIHSRTYGDEHVFKSGNAAVYIGGGTEHVPADGDAQAYEQPGANTLVWVRTGTRWQLVLWQWDPTDEATERASWDRGLANGRFNRKPNATLVEAVKGRKPGAALDLASGQGRNVVFLASAGWKATGVDYSETGLAITRRDAANKKLKVETVQQDLKTYDFGTNKWDLISMIYVPRGAAFIDKIKPALKKGGLFVAEYFAVGPDDPEGLDLDKLKASFKDWKIVRAERVEDIADWGNGSKTPLVRFVAEKP